MGRPIAGRNKSPFGINGILVDGAVLQDGTGLTDIRISKQRSDKIFDLLSADGETVYEYMELAVLDYDGTKMSPTLERGQFCIGITDSEGVIVGYASKLLYNKVILGNGKTVYNNK